MQTKHCGYSTPARMRHEPHTHLTDGEWWHCPGGKEGERNKAVPGQASAPCAGCGKRPARRGYVTCDHCAAPMVLTADEKIKRLPVNPDIYR